MHKNPGVPGPDGFLPDSDPYEAHYGLFYTGSKKPKAVPHKKKTKCFPRHDEEILLLAEAVIDACWNRKLPVDPLLIARYAGVPCKPAWNMPRISAYAFDATIQKAIVFYNPKPRDTKITRFAIAHAIGHHLLHHGSCGLRFRTSHPFVCQEEEQQAHLFAMRMLMPDTAVVHTLRKGVNSGHVLMKIFDVEKTIVIHRIKEMKKSGALDRILPGMEATFFGSDERILENTA